MRSFKFQGEGAEGTERARARPHPGPLPQERENATATVVDSHVDFNVASSKREKLMSPKFIGIDEAMPSN